MNNWNISEQAAALHQNALVWDNHVCPPHKVEDKWVHELERHRNSGADVITISIAGNDGTGLDVTMRMAAYYRHWIAQHPDRYVHVLTADDVRKAKQENKLGIAFNVENPGDMGDQLSLVSLFYDLGVRWMIMAYNKPNAIGGGCQEDDPGLTDFGRKVIAEMDRVGMFKCCSHTGYRTAMDVLTNTDVPTLFTHSNPAALKKHPRNIPDELIDACAATGGIVGINGVSVFLGDKDCKASTVAEHIDYVVQRIGADHVGLGIDYAYDEEEMFELLTKYAHKWPAHLEYTPDMKIMAPEGLPEITEELLKRNYSETDIRNILGENLLRVAGQVWK